MKNIFVKYFAVVGVCVFLFFWIRVIFDSKITVIDKEETISTIDSVWFTSPGQENTLQTDYRYYGKASNGQVIVSTGRAFHIGDSIVCIYYRYENTKTEKKH